VKFSISTHQFEKKMVSKNHDHPLDWILMWADSKIHRGSKVMIDNERISFSSFFGRFGYRCYISTSDRWKLLNFSYVTVRGYFKRFVFSDSH
jgi:hypothetical protein